MSPAYTTMRFFPRAFAAIIADSAQATRSRGLPAFSGPCAMPTETVISPAASTGRAPSRSVSRRASPSASPASQDGMITANSSPPRRQTTSLVRTSEQVELRERDEDLVADRVPADVVDALELVDVEHQQRHRVAGAARAHELGAQPLVEVAVVVEARQRVGLCLVLQPRAHLRVVERERRRIAEPLRELELVVVERAVSPSR